MRVLHVTGSKLVKRSGILGVLVNLPLEQNKIEGTVSRVIIVDNDFEGEKPDYIDMININNLKSYLGSFNPDIIIIHDFYVPNYRIITKIIRKCKIPYYLEPHGAFGHSAMKKSHIKKIVANNTIFRNTIKKASGFIFTTPGEVDDSVYHNKVETIIENGIDKNIVLQSMKSEKHNLEDPVIYFMGRFRIIHKGLDYLFDALDILNNEHAHVNFKVFGTSTEQEVAYVKSRIEKLDNLNIKYCGVVYGEDRNIELISNCNILCLTSRYEGSPLAVLDAYSCGNPVIVTPGTNVSQEVVDNKLGWRTELDPRAIADTILVAINDYKKSPLEYRERVHQYVLNNFTWEKMAKLSIVEYSKLLEKSRSK